MDFSLTYLMVVPSDNSVPTSGYPYEMSEGQVGVFKADYTAATTGNVANEKQILIAQQRDKNDKLKSLKSDWIAKGQIKSYTKVTGSDVAANEIWDISDFNVSCGEDVSLSIRAHSFYIDTAFYNGLTKGVTVTAPCCDCGDSPCDKVDVEKIVDLLIEQLQSDFSYDRESVNLQKYFDFLKLGSGDSTKLRIVAKPLDKDGSICDLAANPYLFDRLYFQPFVVKGTDTNADYIVYDNCDVAATTTLVQRSTYPKLTAEEVKSMELDYYGFKVPNFKKLYRLSGYNPYFKSQVEDGKVYDQYMITFYPSNNDNSWQDNMVQDERVILLVPNDGNDDVIDILTAYAGSPVDESGNVVTTTTTTSTSSTTTTSTTAAPIIP